jgi:hypothetical protein
MLFPESELFGKKIGFLPPSLRQKRATGQLLVLTPLKPKLVLTPLEPKEGENGPPVHIPAMGGPGGTPSPYPVPHSKGVTGMG